MCRVIIVPVVILIALQKRYMGHDTSFASSRDGLEYDLYTWAADGGPVVKTQRPYRNWNMDRTKNR